MKEIEIPDVVSIGGTINYFRDDRFFNKRYKDQLRKLQNDYSISWKEKQKIAHDIIRDYFNFMDNAVKE